MCAWLCVRARCAKIVVDTEKWKLFWLRNFFLIAAKEWVKNRQQRFVMINLRRVAPHYHTACIPLCRFVCEIRRCIHRFGIESETQRFSFLWRRFKLCTCVCVCWLVFEYNYFRLSSLLNIKFGASNIFMTFSLIIFSVTDFFLNFKVFLIIFWKKFKLDRKGDFMLQLHLTHLISPFKVPYNIRRI